MSAGLAATSTQTMASHCTTSPQALNPGAPEGTTGGRTAPDTRTEPSGSYVDVDGPRTAKGGQRGARTRAGCTDQSGGVQEAAPMQGVVGQATGPTGVSGGKELAGHYPPQPESAYGGERSRCGKELYGPQSGV